MIIHTFSSNKLDYVLTPLLTEKKNYREFIVRDQRKPKLNNLFIKVSLNMWKTKIHRMTLLIPVRYCPTTQTRYTWFDGFRKHRLELNRQALLTVLKRGLGLHERKWCPSYTIVLELWQLSSRILEHLFFWWRELRWKVTAQFKCSKLINTSSPTEKIADLIVNEFDYYTHCVKPEPIIETVYQQPAQVFQIPFEGKSRIVWNGL